MTRISLTAEVRQYTVSQLRAKQGRLGQTQVVWSDCVLSGKSALVVASETDSGKKTLSIALKGEEGSR